MVVLWFRPFRSHLSSISIAGWALSLFALDSPLMFFGLSTQIYSVSDGYLLWRLPLLVPDFTRLDLNCSADQCQSRRPNFKLNYHSGYVLRSPLPREAPSFRTYAEPAFGYSTVAPERSGSMVIRKLFRRSLMQLEVDDAARCWQHRCPRSRANKERRRKLGL